MDDSVETIVQGAISPEYHLAITLTNRSAKPVTIYEHSLPWVGRYSLLLKVVKADAVGTDVEMSRPIDDPGAAEVTIQPGETLSGHISLVQRFPGFVDALQERDVIVFWSYQFQPVDGPPLPRTGGYLLFPKVETSG